MKLLLAFLLAAVAASAADLKQLGTVRRVFVDRLTGGESADAVLRGAAEDLVFTEIHQSSDSINARANLGGSRGAYNSRQTGAVGIGIGDSESDRSAERRHEAIAAVRLVNKAGDVIWSTTQESIGAKFHGASADVADKITAKLKEDVERGRKLK